MPTMFFILLGLLIFTISIIVICRHPRIQAKIYPFELIIIKTDPPNTPIGMKKTLGDSQTTKRFWSEKNRSYYIKEHEYVALDADTEASQRVYDENHA